MREACGAVAVADTDLEVVFDARQRARERERSTPDCVREHPRRPPGGSAISHRDMYSGAGHDACNLALAAPTGMIFVPCERGHQSQ